MRKLNLSIDDACQRFEDALVNLERKIIYLPERVEELEKNERREWKYRQSKIPT